MATETQEQKCERCLSDGLEPNEDCPFYGEPNGCNSPTYGKFPLPANLVVSKKETTTQGNTAKMREALEWLQARLVAAVYDGSIDAREALEKVEAALAAPPRNCDLARDWLHDLYVKFKPPASVRREMPPEWVDAVMAFCRWLVKPVKEGGAE